MFATPYSFVSNHVGQRVNVVLLNLSLSVVSCRIMDFTFSVLLLHYASHACSIWTLALARCLLSYTLIAPYIVIPRWTLLRSVFVHITFLFVPPPPKNTTVHIVLLLGPLAFGQFTPSPTYPTVHYLPTFSSIVYLVLPPTPFLVH